MVAKTIGFNWGPAGTSCSTWTGVRLTDLLQHCGMQGQQQGAHCVCFRGPKHELPQGVLGSMEVAVMHRHRVGCDCTVFILVLIQLES
jgi:nitrate reductase (NAD(P)H)